MTDTTLIELSNRPGGLPNSRVYYYQGNFFHPVELIGNEIGKVKKAIREFTKNNRKMIEQDQASPDYKTVVQLFDEQEKQYAMDQN